MFFNGGLVSEACGMLYTPLYMKIV